MSVLHAAAAYRRNGQDSIRVPVVMPLVQVTVDDEGGVDVLLDHEPYSAIGALHRNDVHWVLNDIAADLGTPLRVEVREANGTSFTDIVTPPQRAPLTAAQRAAHQQPAHSLAGDISGDGFLPREEIAVTVVVTHLVADNDGTARLRLPPALLAAHPGLVVLIGRTSGTVVVSDAAT